MMTLSEFRRFRDEHALQRQRARLGHLIEVRERLYARYQEHLQMLRWAKQKLWKDRTEINHLEDELYNPEFGLACLWAQVDAEICDIQRDMPMRVARLKVIPLVGAESQDPFTVSGNKVGG